MFPASSTGQHSQQLFKNIQNLIQESASYSESKQLNFVKSWLRNIYHQHINSEGIDNYLAQQAHITRSIINARLNSEGVYSCQINANGRQYSITQTHAASDSIILCDIQSNQQIRLDGIGFLTLKREFLIKHIEQPRHHCYIRTHLGELDLTGIDLTELNFKDISLSAHNVAVIVAQGGNLVGAKLAPNADLRGICLNEKVVVDQEIVSALVNAGLELKSVLQHYFSTPPTQLSRQFKAGILAQFLEQERLAENVPVALDEFDVSDVDFQCVNLSGTWLKLNHLRLIIACGGDLSGATLVDGIDATQLKLNNVKLDQPVAQQLVLAGADR